MATPKLSMLFIAGALFLLTFASASAQDATPEATAEPAQPPLVGTEWQWQAFQGSDDSTITVETPSDYILTFNEDGSLGLRADCNVGTASYTLDGSSLTIIPGVMTLAMCPEGSLSQDFLNYLSNVASYVIEDGDLHLSLAVDGGILRFSPTAIIGVEWQWQEFQGMDDTITVVDAPANYTLLLNEDGSVGVKADCNTGGGSYTLDGNALTFSPLASTLMACPGDSLGSQFLAYLGDVVSYTIQDGELYLALKTDGGILRFAAAPPAIVDTVWQWQDFQSMDGTLTEVDMPENYTLILNTDGTANVKADCNTGGGGYTLDGSQLTFGALAITRAACPEGSLSDAYLGYLADVRSFVVTDGELFLSLPMDGGILRFAAAE